MRTNQTSPITSYIYDNKILMNPFTIILLVFNDRNNTITLNHEQLNRTGFTWFTSTTFRTALTKQLHKKSF